VLSNLRPKRWDFCGVNQLAEEEPEYITTLPSPAKYPSLLAKAAHMNLGYSASSCTLFIGEDKGIPSK